MRHSSIRRSGRWFSSSYSGCSAASSLCETLAGTFGCRPFGDMNNVYYFTSSYTVAESNQPGITIEAEYGDRVVEGGLYTAAHHQPDMKGLPAPCCDWDIPVCEGASVIISHFDLDTLGGCLRTEDGCQDLFFLERHAFWRLAEYVDLNGPHMMGQYLFRSSRSYYSQEQHQIHAFWAWSKTLPRLQGDELQNVTDVIKKGAHALRKIFSGDPDLIEAGVAFKKAEEDLNTSSFWDAEFSEAGDYDDKVILRISDTFVNHLYTAPEDSRMEHDKVFGGVSALNTATGAVTISLSRPIEGVSCRQIMQDLFGDEAGGHDGIAGTPRGKSFEEADRDRAADALAKAISASKAE